MCTNVSKPANLSQGSALIMLALVKLVARPVVYHTHLNKVSFTIKNDEWVEKYAPWQIYHCNSIRLDTFVALPLTDWNPHRGRVKIIRKWKSHFKIIPLSLAFPWPAPLLYQWAWYDINQLSWVDIKKALEYPGLSNFFTELKNKTT